MQNTEVLSLEQKIFIVKSYYRYHENELVVRDELQRTFQLETDQEVIDSIRKLIQVFDQKGSIIEAVCHYRANNIKTLNDTDNKESKAIITNLERKEINIELKLDPLDLENDEANEDDKEAKLETTHIQIPLESKQQLNAKEESNSIFVCNICKKIFSRQVYLKKHMTIHSEAKPYECSKCGQGFKWKTVMQKHMITHEKGENRTRIKCEICGKILIKESLFTHQKRHEAVRRHICDICGKSFVCESELKQHSGRHKTEKQFQCSICHKKFAYEASLKRHKIAHTGVRRHKCEVCNQSFSTSQIRNAHQRIHTGERPFPCQICEKSFRQQAGLRKHLIHIHGTIYGTKSQDTGD